MIKIMLNFNLNIGNNNLFRKLSESSDDIIFIFNPIRKVFIFINKKVEDILGYTEHEIKDMGSKALENIIYEKDYPVFSSRYFQILTETEQKESYNFSIRLITKDGKIKIFRITVSVLDRQTDGEPKQIFGIARDVTNIKEKDFTLKENINYFRSILSELHEDIFVINRDYEIIDVSGDFIKSLALEREKIIGQKCYKLFHDFDEPCQFNGKECYLQKVFETQQSYRYKHIIRNAKKEYRHLLINMSPILNGNGKVENVLEAVKDITNEENLNFARLQSEERYSSLFKMAMNMIHILDENGIIQEVNASWLNKFGYAEEEVLGKHISNFIHEKYKGYLHDIFKKVKENKKPLSHQIVFLSKTGADIFVNENISPIIINGEISSIQVILEDLTDIERAKEISNQNLLLNGVNRILNETLEADSLESVALFALKVTEMITGSKFGMIGLLNGKSNTLKVLASTHEVFLNIMRKNDHSRLREIPIRGLLAKIIKNKESYFTNDYRSDPNAYNLPNNHPELVCVLGTPLFIGDMEFGIVIVANSPMGYSRFDKNNLQSLASTISTVLKRKQTDIELMQHKENLENLLDQRTKKIKELNKTLKEKIALSEKISKAYIQSEKRYKRLFDEAPIGMYRSNEMGEIILANKRLLEMLGYSSLEELAKKLTAIELYPENENREKFIELIQKEGSIHNFKTQLIRKNGEIIDVIENANLLYDENEKIYYFEGIIQDITQQKKDKELIEILSAAIAQTPTFVIVTDIEGNIEYANKAFAKITGFSNKETIGQNPKILKSGFHDDNFYKEMWNTIVSGKAWISEFHNKKKNGEYFWTNAIIFPIKNAENKIIRFVSIQEDITEKKLILDELIKAKEEAEKADKLKSEFLAQISHEIRTPLTSMISFTSLLQSELENVVDEELGYSFEAIKNSAKRITRTVDLILNVAQLETDTYDFQPSEIEVNDQILEDIYLEYFKYSKQKKLGFVFEKEISPFYYTGDEYTLRQIFTNLIDNAIKFTETGAVEIKTFVDKKKKRRVVKISDTGVGISKDYLPHLFDKFTQEEQGYTRKFDGNGLGMVLVKKYCELNNLNLEVESEKGKGTIIKVIFPN